MVRRTAADTDGTEVVKNCSTRRGEAGETRPTRSPYRALQLPRFAESARSKEPSYRRTWSAALASSPAGSEPTFAATGYLDTDYAAKGRYAIAALADHDLVCVHVEAWTRRAARPRAAAKVEALERIDEDIVGPVLKALEQFPSWRILVSPDHATLLRTRAHDRDWATWAMAGTGLSGSGYPYDDGSVRR